MELVMVDRAGSVRVLTPERRRFLHPRLSPAGDRVAVEVSPEGNEVLDIWTLNVSSRQLTRLTSDGMSVGPEWSRDGSRVYWTSGKSERDRHVWTQSWD